MDVGIGHGHSIRSCQVRHPFGNEHIFGHSQPGFSHGRSGADGPTSWWATQGQVDPVHGQRRDIWPKKQGEGRGGKAINFNLIQTILITLNETSLSCSED